MNCGGLKGVGILKGRVGMVVLAAEQATVWFPFFTDPEPKLLKVMPPKCGDHSADGIRQPIRLVGLIKLTTTTFRQHTFRHHLYYIVHNKEVGMPQ